MLNPTPNGRLLNWNARPQKAAPAKTAPLAPAAKPAKPGFGTDILAFKKADRNGDGKLTSDEYGVGPLRQAAFGRADLDHDGAVTEGEFVTVRAAQRLDVSLDNLADSDLAFLIGQYQEHLGRMPDVQGLTHYMTQLGSGAMTREQVTEALKASPEAQARATNAVTAPAEATPVFGYTIRYAHSATTLAQDFNVKPEVLAELNGWPSIDHPVPAGTVVRVPDSSETRAAAARYGGPVTEIDANAPVAPAPSAEPGHGGIGIADPNAHFMTQFYHEQWNPTGPSGSANCGPTSLAMALDAVGLAVPGVTPVAPPEQVIDKTREAMGAMTDSYGNYGDKAYTNIGQVIDGAHAAGATTEPVTFETIDAALAAGKPVAAAGNPSVYNGDWADRGISNSEYDGGHFITIMAKDADGNYLINDPLSNVGTVAITPAELQAYMGYYGPGSAVAISNPNAPAPSAPIQPSAPAGAANPHTAHLMGIMTPADVEAVLVARGSVLAGTGISDYIVEMERKYGVPAVQFLAQAVMESSLGNDGYTMPGFNIGNIRPGTSWTGPIVNGGSGEFRVYGSWEEGIEDYFKLLAGPIYSDKNLEDQIYTYAPPFENDTAHYYDQVYKLIIQWTGVQP